MLAAALSLGSMRARGATETGAPPAAESCITCHAGIEEMHPGFTLGCVDCHGGDDSATTAEEAHVRPSLLVPTDERVLPRNHDLAYVRFRNPTDLRVAGQVCGDCHGDLVAHVEKSLHSTTAGHLSDGYYEHGLTASKTAGYSVFPVRDTSGDLPPHALAATTQVPPPKTHGPADAIETHYSDLPRKACMSCHLWSSGRAVRGRVGMDGDYRGAGCAACHVTYDDDGRSRSRDPTIDKLEPGHPREHRLTTRIPTSTCTRCHYGDASIGMHYRGLAQLVPGMPAGPEVPGTTSTPLNGTFYIQDEDLTPPDIHHERGLHCIDCHTLADTMGDGRIWPNMDHAVEIECQSCHGTFTRVTGMMTSHGARVPNLERRGDEFFLRSKVTGKAHRVVQVAHLLDPQHRDFNERAAAAMTPQHERLECYACHTGWNVDFFGFHFDRNEQFTQLDLISGERTPGRVTTQEKVFATFNQLRLGWNHEGAIAPWVVGFSTIGTAHDATGGAPLWQAVPRTRAGLSGVTMIPHQVHAVRPEARTCVECHRSPATWGLGSANFRLVRELGYAVGGRAFYTIALDAQTPGRTGIAASLELDAEPRTVAVRIDPVAARATHAYVGCADGKLAVIDLRAPVLPKLLSAKPVLADPRRMLVQSDRLFVADGPGGVALFDVTRPATPRLVTVLPTTDARAVALAFPWLLVADGAQGLLIFDVADANAPRWLATVDLNGTSSDPNEALDLAVLFQYSRTQREDDRLERSPARHLAFVAGGLDGVRIVDFTEPEHPRLLDGRAVRRAFRNERGDVRGIAVNTVFDIGSAGGGLRSRERDYLYVYSADGDDDRRARLRVYDVSDPAAPRAVPRGSIAVRGGTGRLLMFRSYNPPFLQHRVAAVGAGGLGTLVDVSKVAAGLEVAATWEMPADVRDLVFEELALDRLQDEDGDPIMDVSHEGCRYLLPEEILRVLRAPLPQSK